jgi:hypothetical protein
MRRIDVSALTEASIESLCVEDPFMYFSFLIPRAIMQGRCWVLCAVTTLLQGIWGADAAGGVGVNEFERLALLNDEDGEEDKGSAGFLWCISCIQRGSVCAKKQSQRVVVIEFHGTCFLLKTNDILCYHISLDFLTSGDLTNIT